MTGLAGRRLIRLPIPDSQHENPRGIGKDRLLTRSCLSPASASEQTDCSEGLRCRYSGNFIVAQKRLVAPVLTKIVEVRVDDDTLCRERVEPSLGVPGMCRGVPGMRVGKRCEWLIDKPLERPSAD